MIYDSTAGMIETPGGIGRFVEFDGNNGVVTAEMDNRYLVFYPAEDCYINKTRKSRLIKDSKTKCFVLSISKMLRKIKGGRNNARRYMDGLRRLWRWFSVF